MAVSGPRNIVDLKEKGHFQHKNENERIDKYTLSDELPSRLQHLQLTTQPGYSVRLLTAQDKDAVINFLDRFFFRDEPMNLAVGLLDTPNSRCVELEEYSISTLKEEVSVAAVDQNGCLVGVMINGIARKENIDNSDKSVDCPNEKFCRILKVLAHLDREAKVWDKLPASCKAIMEGRIASTHTDWRGKGIMRVLCEESERVARSLCACAMRMDATSAFSAAAATRLGYKKVYSVPYADLPFAPVPEPPHTEASVFIKELK